MIVELIKKWANIFRLPVRNEPQLLSKGESDLNYKMLASEVEELEDAYKADDLSEIIDAYGDIVWLGIRGIQSHGVKPEYVISKIFDSNMTKRIGSDKMEYERMLAPSTYTFRQIEGGYVVVNGIGKVAKPSTYCPPDWSELKKYNNESPR